MMPKLEQNNVTQTVNRKRCVPVVRMSGRCVTHVVKCEISYKLQTQLRPTTKKLCCYVAFCRTHETKRAWGSICILNKPWNWPGKVQQTSAPATCRKTNILRTQGFRVGRAVCTPQREEGFLSVCLVNSLNDLLHYVLLKSHIFGPLKLFPVFHFRVVVHLKELHRGAASQFWLNTNFLDNSLLWDLRTFSFF